jgi:hypothetical protein
MFDYLDAEEGGEEDMIKNALAEVIELNKKIRGSPDGSEKTELAARAGLQAATVLLYVYGHAHEEERAWWDRRSCREMFTTVEKLVEEEELVDAYKIMCTDPQLKCGVFCEEHRRHKFTVDFYVKKSCPHKTYVYLRVYLLCHCTCLPGVEVPMCLPFLGFCVCAHSPVGRGRRGRRGRRRRRRRGRRRSWRRRRRRRRTSLLSTTDVVCRPGCRRTCQSPPPLSRYQPATTPKLTITRRHLHTVSFRASKTARVQETLKGELLEKLFGRMEDYIEAEFPSEKRQG